MFWALLKTLLNILLKFNWIESQVHEDEVGLLAGPPLLVQPVEDLALHHPDVAAQVPDDGGFDDVDKMNRVELIPQKVGVKKYGAGFINRVFATILI